MPMIQVREEPVNILISMDHIVAIITKEHLIRVFSDI